MRETIGPYRIVAKLGEGGMGEVYRARDTKLGRDVALKILPDLFSSDPDRQARFRREATVLASLNHPNIAAIYSVERFPVSSSAEDGHPESSGAHALVLELVEGPTLADRLKQGPLDQAEAFGIARQIADAIEAAHEAGVIHRDLKPANVKVRPDGTVKVLDFGLAKALDSTDGSGARDLSNSPTVTSPAHTAMGIILGTAAYMAPEQARGRPVDRRADIWAFGCVLFEMLTGRAAFAGDNVTDTLAAVVRGEPAWALLPEDTPPSVRRLLRRCLAKERKERLSDIGSARLEIDEATRPVLANETTSTVTRRDVRLPPWGLAVAFAAGAVAAGLAVWMLRPTPAPAAPSTLRFDLGLPDDTEFVGNAGSGVAIAPDGLHVAYTGASAGSPQQIFVRDLVSGETVLLRSAAAYSPFMSPDGRQAGFISSGILWRAPVEGGTPAEIGKISDSDRGVAWSSDGFIYSGGAEGLSRIPESGGVREPLTQVNKEAGEIGHRFPAVVPGGRAILFTIFKGGLDDARIGVLDLASRQVRVLFDRPAHSAQVVGGTHLVYVRSGALMAAPFDASRVEVMGEPKPVVNGIAFNNGGAAHFAVSASGTLVYQPTEMVRKRRLVWRDPQGGAITAIDAPIDHYSSVALSPDGRRIALIRHDQNQRSAVLIWDVDRKAMTSVSRAPGYYENPIWTPDGRSLVFVERAQLGSFGRLMRQPVDGSTAPVEIAASPAAQTYGGSGRFPGSFLGDGSTLLYDERGNAVEGIFAWDVSTAATTRLDVAGFDPRISPDGRWLAYVARSGTAPVVSVAPYPDTSGGRWTVSSGPAARPRWSRDGRQLFYAAPGGIFAVNVSATPAFTATAPVRVSDASDFDVAADGRLAVFIDEEIRLPRPVVVLNWYDELKRLALAR